MYVNVQWGHVHLHWSVVLWMRTCNSWSHTIYSPNDSEAPPRHYSKYADACLNQKLSWFKIPNGCRMHKCHHKLPVTHRSREQEHWRKLIRYASLVSDIFLQMEECRMPVRTIIWPHPHTINHIPTPSCTMLNLDCTDHGNDGINLWTGNITALQLWAVYAKKSAAFVWMLCTTEIVTMLDMNMNMNICKDHYAFLKIRLPVTLPFKLLKLLYRYT
jgi:hypothetical protein